MIKIKNRCCYTVTLILCGTLFLTGLTGCKSREAQFLIEGLPGVGPSIAKKLLEHFGSAQAVLGASPEQFKAVRGMGPKTIANIREVLDFKI